MNQQERQELANYRITKYFASPGTGIRQVNQINLPSDVPASAAAAA